MSQRYPSNLVSSTDYTRQRTINRLLELLPKSSKTVLKRIPGVRRFARALGVSQDYTKHRRFLLDVLPKNSVGAEIGVNMGNFAEQILEVVRPAELHLIDPWKHETAAIYKGAVYGGRANRGQEEMDKRHMSVIRRFAKEIDARCVNVHRGESVKVLNEFSDGYFDWVYIDGNHLYEYVVKDLALASRKTKIGGYITGDDYTEGGWWKGSVKKAVDEFATTGSVQLIQVRNEQFIFRRIP
jgi:Methyltransferase domain